MPPESTVRSWITNNTGGFAAEYHRAQLLRIDCLADELLCVAYDKEMDPADKRVITENLRWLLGKMALRRFSDRLLVAGDPDAPVYHLHEHQVQAALEALSPAQCQALENFTRSVLETREGGT